MSEPMNEILKEACDFMNENIKEADLIAPEGMIYTDGNGVYATKIWLGEGVLADKFHLITREEYEKILNEETESVSGL